jgi:hypothetical protein
MTSFEILSSHLSEGTEGNHEEQKGWLASGLRLDPVPPRYRTGCYQFNHKIDASVLGM